MQLLVSVSDGGKGRHLSLSLPPTTSLRSFKRTLFGSLLQGCITEESLFRLVLNGKPLRAAHTGDDASLIELGFRHLDTVSLVPALRGGGGDGGATGAESRDCYLQMYAKKKPGKVDPKDTRAARWTTCLLSNEPLTPPCVVDRLGNLLNKEAILRALQSKTMPVLLKHIRGLKDVTDIKLHDIPGISEDAHVRFQCPISGVEFSGNFRFFAMKCCGQVLSQKALKELKLESKCPMCHASLSAKDRLPINGTPEEVLELRKQIDEERAKVKAERERKKVQTAHVSGAPATTAGPSSCGEGAGQLSRPAQEGGALQGKIGKGSVVKPSAALGAAAAEAEAKKDCNPDKGVTKRASGGDQHAAKKYKAGDHAPAGATKEIYASIFTSSRKDDFKETYSCRSLPLARN